jgi:hypothetical protein
VGFFAGFAFALAIATPPSFAYAPGAHAKVEKWGIFRPGGPRDLCSSVDGPAPPTLLALPKPYLLRLTLAVAYATVRVVAL